MFYFLNVTYYVLISQTKALKRPFNEIQVTGYFRIICKFQNNVLK
jgi:hypothetical protein